MNAAKEKFESPGFEFFHKLLEKIHNVLGKIGEAMSHVKNFFVLAFQKIGQAYKITTKMEDSDGNYVTDANGDYIETVVLLANPDDLLSILERVVALEKAVYEK